MKYQDVINEALASTNLKKVMIKTDPKTTGDFETAEEYVGYVLAEDPEIARVMVMSPGMPVDDYPLGAIETCDEPVLPFQLFAVHQIVDQGKDLNSAEIQAVANSETLADIEASLRQVGLSDAEMLKLYRNFINVQEN